MSKPRLPPQARTPHALKLPKQVKTALMPGKAAR